MSAQSATPILEAQSREITGKHVKQLRKAGRIPVVLYGHNVENRSLSLDAHSFEKMFNEVGHTTLLALSIDGKSVGKVLVHDVQTDAIRRQLTHVDLYQVNLKEKLTTEIPLSFIGISEAVDTLGGTLSTVKDAVEVECLPDDLVQEIEVDISSLKTFEDAIHVSDLIAPKGITILDEVDQLIASVTEPRSEAELAELDTEVVAPEVAFETKDGTEKPAEDSGK
jgi:large subunit ribosomal protein L25